MNPFSRVAGTLHQVSAVNHLSVMLRHQNIRRKKYIAAQCRLPTAHYYAFDYLSIFCLLRWQKVNMLRCTNNT
jgi:hypothetical protein